MMDTHVSRDEHSLERTNEPTNHLLALFRLSPLPSLAISGRTMLEGEGWEGAGESTPRSRLDGTLDFLQKQFKQVIDDQVQCAVKSKAYFVVVEH